MCRINIYIIAISLQFAGAIILVKRFNPIKARAFIFKSIEEDKEKGGTDFGEFDEEGQFRIVEKEILQAKAEEIYLNGLAFGYIAIGYVLGIFGEIHCNKYIIAAFVVALAILLMGAGTWICRHCAEKNFPEDIQVRDS